MSSEFPKELRSTRHSYQIIRRNPRTGIYLAEADTGELVSVRAISKRAGSEFSARFQRDAENLNRVNSPHVVKIRDFGTADEYLFVVLENLQGKSLAEVLEEQGPLDEIEVAGIGSQLAKALEQIHASRVIHQSIRPHNILRTASGEIKLWDFGVARNIQFARLERGDVLGEDAYLAPEQVESTGNPVDIRADIYAVGAVMYELLTGRPPFEADSRLKLSLKIVTTPPTPLQRYRNNVLEAIEKIVMRCLAKRPEERFQTPEELTQVLAATRLQEYKTSEDFLFARAQKAWSNDDWELTIRYCEELVQRAPNSNKAKEARALMSQAEHRGLEEKRKNLDRLYNTAIAAAQGQEYDRAQEICRAILHIDPSYAAASDLIVRLQRDQDRASLVSVDGHTYTIVGTGALIGRPDTKRSIVPQVDLSQESKGNTVSRQHAQISCVGGQWFLQALPSMNMTKVGHEELQQGIKRRLVDGDTVYLGGVELTFHIQSASTEH